MIEKETSDFIKSVSGGKERTILTFMNSHTRIHQRACTKTHVNFSNLCLSKETSLPSFSQQNVTYLNCKYVLQFFTYSWVFLKVLIQVPISGSINSIDESIKIYHDTTTTECTHWTRGQG